MELLINYFGNILWKPKSEDKQDPPSGLVENFTTGMKRSGTPNDRGNKSMNEVLTLFVIIFKYFNIQETWRFAAFNKKKTYKDLYQTETEAIKYFSYSSTNKTKNCFFLSFPKFWYLNKAK